MCFCLALANRDPEKQSQKTWKKVEREQHSINVAGHCPNWYDFNSRSSMDGRLKISFKNAKKIFAGKKKY